MASPLRTANEGTFFVTAVTADRRRLFQTDTNAQLLLETLQHYRQEKFYLLHAFVVMPDHIHLLITTEDLPAAMQRIKGGFSHRLGSKVPIWQKGYTDHQVRNAEEFRSRRGYILQNPVRARLTERVEDFPYSSAFRKDG
ncbi:MAG TPA: transposase [Acidobacteriaceae bacterium]|jgi:putative transposase